MSGAGGPPALHDLGFMGSGTFGCVLRATLPCESSTQVQLLKTQPAFSSTTVAKVTIDQGVSRIRNIAQILHEIDPSHTFTVPLETQCRLTDAATARVFAEPDCDQLKQTRQSWSYPALAQVTMREAQPLRKLMDTLVTLPSSKFPLSFLLEILNNFFYEVWSMEDFEIGHGDIKLDNVVYASADAKLRLIDYDFLYAYDLRTPLAVNTDMSVSYDMVLPSLPTPILLQRLRDATHHAGAVTSFGQAWYFPPENIFTNVHQLFTADVRKEAQIYNRFHAGLEPASALKLNAAWQACFNDEFLPAVLAAQSAGRDAYIAALNKQLLRYYQPAKKTVFQCGYVLYEALQLARAQFDALDPTLAPELVDIISAMMMPLPSRRIVFDDVTSLLTAMSEKVREAEETVPAPAVPAAKKASKKRKTPSTSPAVTRSRK